MVVRNLIGIVGAAAFYFALFYYGLQFFESRGANALLILVSLHFGFGVAGYFIFTGSVTLRAVCVFLVIATYAVISQLMWPDTGHAMVQVFVAIPFGILAAVGTHGGWLLEKIWARDRAA